jgi:hypothetical protein
VFFPSRENKPQISFLIFGWAIDFSAAKKKVFLFSVVSRRQPRKYFAFFAFLSVVPPTWCPTATVCQGLGSENAVL